MSPFFSQSLIFVLWFAMETQIGQIENQYERSRENVFWNSYLPYFLSDTQITNITENSENFFFPLKSAVPAVSIDIHNYCIIAVR